MSRHRPRWYGSNAFGVTDKQMPVVPWQTGGFARHEAYPREGQRRMMLPEPIARLAYEEYANQGHGRQSFDRLHERGGFGVTEVITLLADLIERERAKP